MGSGTTRSAVIIDQHPLWLEAFEWLLEPLRITVVARTTCLRDLVALCEENRPDLVIVDYDLLAHDLASLIDVRQVQPEVKCVVFTSSDELAVRECAFRAGADMVCVRRADVNDLAAAIRLTFKGTIHFATAPSVCASTAVPTNGASPDESTLAVAGSAEASLTKREREVLTLAAEGHSNAEVAQMLWVTEQTVKFHLSNAYRKLGVTNRTGASRWAYENGLLDKAQTSDDAALDETRA